MRACVLGSFLYYPLQILYKYCFFFVSQTPQMICKQWSLLLHTTILKVFCMECQQWRRVFIRYIKHSPCICAQYYFACLCAFVYWKMDAYWNNTFNKCFERFVRDTNMKLDWKLWIQSNGHQFQSHSYRNWTNTI